MNHVLFAVAIASPLLRSGLIEYSGLRRRACSYVICLAVALVSRENGPLKASISAPIVQTQMLNKTINMNVIISDLNTDDYAVEFQFRLCYNSTLLQLVDIGPGSFWRPGSWNAYGEFLNMSFSAFSQVDPVYGSSVLIGITIYKDSLTNQYAAFPYGNGTIATLTFTTIEQQIGLENPPLNCSLSLVQDQIIDVYGDEVPHIIQNGTFEMLPDNIGDLNRDGKVDIRDVHIAALAYGSYGPNYFYPGSPSSPTWNPIADITGPKGVPDNKVDIRDVNLVARNYGWTAIDL